MNNQSEDLIEEKQFRRELRESMLKFDKIEIYRE